MSEPLWTFAVANGLLAALVLALGRRVPLAWAGAWIAAGVAWALPAVGLAGDWPWSLPALQLLHAALLLAGLRRLETLSAPLLLIGLLLPSAVLAALFLPRALPLLPLLSAGFLAAGAWSLRQVPGSRTLRLLAACLAVLLAVVRALPLIYPATDLAAPGGALELVLAVPLLGLAVAATPSEAPEERPVGADLVGTLAALGDGVLRADLHGHVSYLNPTGERLTGRRLSTVLSRPVDEVLSLGDPPSGPPPAHPVRRSLEEGRLVHEAGPLRLLRPNGSSVEIECTASPAYDEHGVINGVVALFRDVAERTSIDQQLQLFARIFENSAEGIMVTDARGEILQVNNAFSRITAYNPEEVIGQTPRVLRSGLHDANFYDNLWSQIQSEGKWEGEIWNRRKDGELYPQRISISAIGGQPGQPSHFVALFKDITEEKRSEDTIHFLAYYDGLTSLPNRQLFEERLVQALRDAHRRGHWVAVLFLDLDRFKDINDSLGHASGDQLLRAMAGRLLDAVRRNDVVARLGGDEFVVLLTELTNGAVASKAAATVAQKILRSVQAPFQLDSHEVQVTTSIGISLAPQDGETQGELIKNADTAMYQAKGGGKGQYRFFSREMNEAILHRMQLEQSLRKALERDEFYLEYQPQVHTSDGTLTGVEALVRWRLPDGQVVSPGKFIQLAEDTGLIMPLDDWVLRHACAQAHTWYEEGKRGFRVAVNLSGRQFHRRNLILQVGRILNETRLPPEYLELEITERSVMADMEGAVEVLTALRQMGMHLALDDFGTGYSSLSYLRRLPIHTLKVDRSFILDIAARGREASIVSAIVELAHSLGLEVVAEGVEETDQYAILREQGCDAVQGYLVSRPLDPEAIAGLLAAGRWDGAAAVSG